jgi:RimJ/RimL family protein N-acetyltransferase
MATMAEQRVVLRPIAEADLSDYVHWLDDPEVTEFMEVESGGHTLESARAWLGQFSGPDSASRVWAIEANGRHIGNCSLTAREAGHSAYFGIVIGDKTAWGKGYGTAATRQALHIGFTEMGLHRIFLHTDARNRRAVRCYEKCGFRHEGVLRKARLKRGTWADTVLMAILREEWREDQSQ